MLQFLSQKTTSNYFKTRSYYESQLLMLYLIHFGSTTQSISGLEVVRNTATCVGGTWSFDKGDPTTLTPGPWTTLRTWSTDHCTDLTVLSPKRTGENPRDIRQIKPKMFAVPASERDPVAVYKLYAAKKRLSEMNHDNATFYLAVNTCKNQDSSKPWFKKSAVGLHKLNSLMKTMAEKAGLGPIVKNHSGRKTII